MIADKTGDIGFVVGDAGIIDMPNGKRYLAAIFVKRPYNDPIVRDFVRRISRIVYNYLDLTCGESIELNHFLFLSFAGRAWE